MRACVQGVKAILAKFSLFFECCLGETQWGTIPDKIRGLNVVETVPWWFIWSVLALIGFKEIRAWDRGPILPSVKHQCEVSSSTYQFESHPKEYYQKFTTKHIEMTLYFILFNKDLISQTARYILYILYTCLLSIKELQKIRIKWGHSK